MTDDADSPSLTTGCPSALRPPRHHLAVIGFEAVSQFSFVLF